MYEVENLSLKILSTHKTALRGLAEQEGETMAVVIRRILRNELESRGLLQPELIKREGINATSEQLIKQPA